MDRMHDRSPPKDSGATPFLQRLLGGPGLRGRIAVRAIALLFVVLSLGGLASFAITALLIKKQVERNIQHEAQLTAQRVELEIDNIYQHLAAMAANPLVSNSLTDTAAGRHVYLTPFLQSDVLVRQGATLALLDFSGAPVSVAQIAAGSVEVPPSMVARVLQRGEAEVDFVRRDGQGDYQMRVLVPVTYPASEQAEGALLLLVALDRILPLPAADTAAPMRFHVQLEDAGTILIGSGASTALLKTQHPLRLDGPFSAHQLYLNAGVDRDSVRRLLAGWLAGYALVGLAALLLVLVAVRRMSRSLTAPLTRLTARVDAIRESGRLDFNWRYAADDEIGRLGRSFQAMVGRVAQVQGELEYRVDARTRELQQSKEQLAALLRFAQSTLDGLTAHICVLDPDGVIRSVNLAWREFAAVAGADPDQVGVGANYLDVCGAGAGEDSMMMVQGVRAVLSGESALFEAEYPCHAPEQQRWFRMRVSRLAGDVGGVVVAHEDITATRLAEDALRVSEERWRFAIDGAGDGMWDWDLRSGIVIRSPRGYAILGLPATPEAAVADAWKQLVHADDLAHVETQLADHLAGRTPTYLAEYRLRAGQGWKWVLDRGLVVTRTSAGEPVRMLGTISDITERKAIESALQDRNAQLDTLLSSSPDGLLSVDHHGVVRFANSAFFRMTGIAPEIILDRPQHDLDACLRRISSDPERYPGLESFCQSLAEQRAGGTRQLLTLSAPRHGVLAVTGVLSRAHTARKLFYFRDVTHEVEVDRMKSDFLATAAHELRTPMASIYGFSELLLTDEFDDETRRDLLRTIHQQTEDLVKIINELLDLARIEAKRGKDFRFGQVDLDVLVRRAIATVAIDLEKWPVTIHGGKPVPLAWGDGDKLHQALVNVLSNAVKYSPSGGPVEVAILCDERARDGQVGVMIRDAGIGMSKAHLSRIFERFFRADASGKIPGSGLGMSIVKEIVDLHGGETIVRSELGVGTEIILWLPAVGQATRAADAHEPALVPDQLAT